MVNVCSYNPNKVLSKKNTGRDFGFCPLMTKGSKFLRFYKFGNEYFFIESTVDETLDVDVVMELNKYFCSVNFSSRASNILHKYILFKYPCRATLICHRFGSRIRMKKVPLFYEKLLVLCFQLFSVRLSPNLTKKNRIFQLGKTVLRLQRSHVITFLAAYTAAK